MVAKAWLLREGGSGESEEEVLGLGAEQLEGRTTAPQSEETSLPGRIPRLTHCTGYK